MPRRKTKPPRALLSQPICRGSSVVYSSLREFERGKQDYYVKDALVYGRLGTPTTFALEDWIAEKENAFGGLAVSSGLAAVTTALLAFAGAGEHVLVADTVYAPTRKFCDGLLRRGGVETTYYDPCIGAGIARLLRDNTRCIYMESPGSLTFEVQDARAIAAAAQRKNITTILDNTWAGAHFYRPLEHGVNVSVISATKYIGGHSDAMLGLIAADEKHYGALRKCRTDLGNCVSPDDAYLCLRGAKTLRARMTQHRESALALAEWLHARADVSRVLHPAYPACPGHEYWKRDFSGSSSLFAFEIEARGHAALAAFLDGLDYFSLGLSWGGCDSLIVPAQPLRTAAPWKSDAQLIRLHAGLEEVDDLKRDLERGLRRYRETRRSAAAG
ncbi:MAG: cystathionine beta-lyase [Gammaproteobacteria bacterium]